LHERAREAVWRTAEEAVQEAASKVVVFPGSVAARRLTAKLGRSGLLLKDEPLICKPIVTARDSRADIDTDTDTDTDTERARGVHASGDAATRSRDASRTRARGRGKSPSPGKSHCPKSGVGDGVGKRRDAAGLLEQMLGLDAQGAENREAPEIGSLRFGDVAGAGTRPIWLNDGWQLRLKRACVPLGEKGRGERAADGDEGADAGGRGGGGGGEEYIWVSHRDDPTSVLFLCQDGLVFYACEDAINDWRGGGVTLLSDEEGPAGPRALTLETISKSEVRNILQRRGMALDFPCDVHEYLPEALRVRHRYRNADANTGLGRGLDPSKPFDPSDPPPNAVFYRNFANPKEQGSWGEYQHRADPAWKVTLC
jgi:hypothetical protein